MITFRLALFFIPSIAFADVMTSDSLPEIHQYSTLIFAVKQSDYDPTRYEFCLGLQEKIVAETRPDRNGKSLYQFEIIGQCESTDSAGITSLKPYNDDFAEVVFKIHNFDDTLDMSDPENLRIILQELVSITEGDADYTMLNFLNFLIPSAHADSLSTSAPTDPWTKGAKAAVRAGLRWLKSRGETGFSLAQQFRIRKFEQWGKIKDVVQWVERKVSLRGARDELFGGLSGYYTRWLRVGFGADGKVVAAQIESIAAKIARLRAVGK